jgi:hypothetical protein
LFVVGEGVGMTKALTDERKKTERKSGKKRQITMALS